jgi:hypothetical protein
MANPKKVPDNKISKVFFFLFLLILLSSSLYSVIVLLVDDEDVNDNEEEEEEQFFLAQYTANNIEDKRKGSCIDSKYILLVNQLSGMTANKIEAINANFLLLLYLYSAIT